MIIETTNNKYLVKFYHSDFTDEKTLLNQKGTTCIVKNLETNEEVVGMAICSLKDQFSRAVGRKLSLQRAISKTLSKNERTEIFNKYFTICKK